LQRISALSRSRQFIATLVLLLIFFVLFEQEKSKVTGFETEQVLDYLPVTDCGIVLTGSSGRIREAFEVFAQKKFKKLIISGVFKDTKLHEIFPQLPFYPEIDPDSVVLEKISGSTYANSVQSLLVAETLKCNSVLLMTSELHMFRAYKMFKAIFPETIRIEKYAVVNPAKETTLLDVYYETFKALFYEIIIFVTTSFN
ncbi:MAG: YdcF family protein, partial [Pseudobdellovibrio sp.]